MLKDDIRRLLNESRGKNLSGQEIAKRLSVSRTAVWKAVGALREDGYRIDAVRNSGYRLIGGDVLSVDTVRSELRHPLEVFCLDTVDSTNAEAKRMLAAGFTGQAVVIAEQQTAGRGRLGRSFYSPAKSGIYLSLILQFDDTIERVMRITSAAALAVCLALEEMSDRRPTIKWVNDVYLDGKKICGILTEAVTDVESGTVRQVVVGIGINITTDDFPDGLSERATSVGYALGRAQLAARVCDRLCELCEKLGDPALMECYRARSMILGSAIDFYIGGEKSSGVAVGIDEDGSLIVDCDGERRTLTSGEVTVRPKGAKL